MFVKRVYIWLILALVLFTGVSIYVTLSEQKESRQNQSGEKLDAHSIEQVFENGGENSSTDNISAPVFSLKSLDGAIHTIGEESKKPRLINFWASWCEACSLESSTLNALHDRFGEEIEFFGINIVTEESELNNIETFIQQHEISYPTLLDEHKRAAYLYDLHSLPTSFLIDANGDVIETFHLLDYPEFAGKLENFLNY